MQWERIFIIQLYVSMVLGTSYVHMIQTLRITVMHCTHTNQLSLPHHKDY